MSISIEFSLSIFIITLTIIFLFHNISIIGSFVCSNLEDSSRIIMAKSIAIGMFTSKYKSNDFFHIFNECRNQCDIDIQNLNCKLKCIILEFNTTNFENPPNLYFSFFIEFNGKLYVVRVLRCEASG
ncbi:MAG: hypothetical protein QW743_05110 [Candidatus Methanomethylicia archaeon]